MKSLLQWRSARHKQKSPLYRCPPEICEHIFAFACTDAGLTGRSLSRVSRYIRLACQSTRYHSVALHGIDQIVAFAAILESAGEISPRVFSLFICDGDREREKAMAKSSRVAIRRVGFPKSNSSHLLEDVETWVSPRPANTIDVQLIIADCISRILSKASATIQNLCLSFRTLHWIPTIPTFPSLPLLTELIVDCFSHVPAALDFVHIPVMPSLGRLYFSGAISIENLWPNIARFAPFLTHLRLSGSTPELQDLLSIVRTQPGCLPPTIQKIFVQPESVPCFAHCAHCGTERNYYIRALSHAQWIACKDDRVVLLNASTPVMDISPCVHLEREWLSRISGGEGCWSEVDRDESICDYPVAEGDRFWGNATLALTAWNEAPPPTQTTPIQTPTPAPGPSKIRSMGSRFAAFRRRS